MSSHITSCNNTKLYGCITSVQRLKSGQVALLNKLNFRLSAQLQEVCQVSVWQCVSVRTKLMPRSTKMGKTITFLANIRWLPNNKSGHYSEDARWDLFVFSLHFPHKTVCAVSENLARPLPLTFLPILSSLIAATYPTTPCSIDCCQWPYMQQFYDSRYDHCTQTRFGYRGHRFTDTVYCLVSNLVSAARTFIR